MHTLDAERRKLVMSTNSYVVDNEIVPAFCSEPPAITPTVTFVALSTVQCGIATGVIATGAIAGTVNIGC